MKKLTILIRCCIIAAITITGCAQPKDAKETTAKNSLSQNVANAYGVENFKNAKTIAFTFNVKRDTATNSRSWLWDIAGNMVTYTKGKDTVTYRRDTVASLTMKKIDGDFINDQYWLLFPYHLVWDSGMVVTQKEKQISPISKKETTMLTVQYGSNVGYTPGDAYDFFIDKDFMILEWNFRRAGAKEPTITSTWDAPTAISGMKLTLGHVNADSTFQLYFTGVKIN